MTFRAKTTTLLFACVAVALGAACTVTSGSIDDNTPTTSTPTADGGGDSDGGDNDGGDSDGATGGDGGSCELGIDFSMLSDTCNSCAGSNCCDLVNACADDPEKQDVLNCTGYAQCFDGCQTDPLGEPTAEACVTKNCDSLAAAGAKEKFLAYNSCLDTKCTADCPAE